MKQYLRTSTVYRCAVVHLKGIYTDYAPHKPFPVLFYFLWQKGLDYVYCVVAEKEVINKQHL